MLAEVKASAADTGGQYTLVEMTAPAGLQTPLHVHYREDEGFYVLDGSVTIEVGEETVELGPGQHAFGPRDVPHRFTVGPDGARMIWILTPSGFEDFVEEVSDRPRRRPSPRRASCRPRTPPRSSCATAWSCCRAECVADARHGVVTVARVGRSGMRSLRSRAVR